MENPVCNIYYLFYGLLAPCFYIKCYFYEEIKSSLPFPDDLRSLNTCIYIFNFIYLHQYEYLIHFQRQPLSVYFIFMFYSFFVRFVWGYIIPVATSYEIHVII